MKINDLKDSFKHYHEKYEPYIAPSFFAIGFIFDLFTLGRIDDLFNLITLALYLIILIVILRSYLKKSTNLPKNNIMRKIRFYRSEIYYFLTGSLVSAFTIFYFKSASLANSLLFMALLIVLLFANEFQFFQRKGGLLKIIYTQFLISSYFIFLIPTLLGQSGFFTFLFSLSISVIILPLCLLDIRNPKKLIQRISVIPFIIFTLYILKLMPPVPLFATKLSVYHKIEKKDGGYLATKHTPNWKFWYKGDQFFRASTNDKIYVFTSVFSPRGYKGKIYMHWLKETPNGFQTSDRIPLKITGGRKEGFRGYTFKSNFSKGNYLVKVETEDNLEIARIAIEVAPQKGSDKNEPIIETL